MGKEDRADVERDRQELEEYGRTVGENRRFWGRKRVLETDDGKVVIGG